MKWIRLFAALLVMSLSVGVTQATQGTFTLSWDPYPVTTATMHGMCKVGSAATATEVGSVPATSNSLDFTIDVPMGASMDCFAFASQGSVTSAVSNTASYTEPVVLPPVTGCALRRH